MEPSRGLRRAGAALTWALTRHRITILQVSLAALLVWFGALKIVGESPVDGLVASTVPGPPWAVVLVGLWEVALGALLLWGRWIRVTLALFVLHMAGTLSTLALLPGVMFRAGNPLLLTLEGEFVVKNLVLVAAGLSIGGQLLDRQAARGRRPPARRVAEAVGGR